MGQSTTEGQTFKLKAGEIVDTTAPYEMVSRMRASFWVLAPLLARCGEAKVSLPGGCAIGTRRVDLHLTTLESLGVSIELEGGYVIAKALKGLTGARVTLTKVSVGATHNALMAAVLARGETLIDMPRASRKSPTLQTASTRWALRSRGSAARSCRSKAWTGFMVPSTRSSPTASRPAPMPWLRP